MNTPVVTQLRHHPATRWGLLAGFALLVATTQLIWLSFAPSTGSTARSLGVSEGAVGDLAVVNPVLFVLLALPAGRLVDRRLRGTLAAGALLTLAGALLRLPHPDSYAWILSGQLTASVAQPLVLTATTALAARCFPARQRALAITAATAAQFVGILAAALSGPVLVAGGGLERLLLVHAVLAGVAAAVVLGLLWVVDAALPAPQPHPWSTVLRDRVVLSLAALLFVGVGVFNAVATWLDAILEALGHPGVAGQLVALTTAFGVAGAVLLPGWAAARGRRRELLIVATATTVAVFAALAALHSVGIVAVLLAVDGFVLLAGLPVALEWSEEHLGSALAGATSAVLLLAGNLGGVVFVLLVQPAVSHPTVAFGMLAIATVPSVIAATRLPKRAPQL